MLIVYLLNCLIVEFQEYYDAVHETLNARFINKGTKIVIFDMMALFWVVLFSCCKVTEFVKKKPLIKRL